jgi:hypothetical protein
MAGMRVYQNLGIGDSAEIPGHFSADLFVVYGATLMENKGFPVKRALGPGIDERNDVLALDIMSTEDTDRLGPQLKQDSIVKGTHYLIGESVYGPFMEEAKVKDVQELVGKNVALYMGPDNFVKGIMPL